MGMSKANAFEHKKSMDAWTDTLSWEDSNSDLFLFVGRKKDTNQGYIYKAGLHGPIVIQPKFINVSFVD